MTGNLLRETYIGNKLLHTINRTLSGLQSLPIFRKPCSGNRKACPEHREPGDESVLNYPAGFRAMYLLTVFDIVSIEYKVVEQVH